MQELRSGYENARIDEITRYRLQRKAVNEYPDLAQFAIYQKASLYRELKQVVEDFFEGTKQFGKFTRVSLGVGEHTRQTPVLNNTGNKI